LERKVASIAMQTLLFTILFFGTWMIDDVGAHAPGVSLSAWTPTPPSIDGIIDSGEWVLADVISFTTSDGLLPGRTGTLYVMNDATNLYLAVAMPDTTPHISDICYFVFDNDHDGLFEMGDDSLRTYGVRPAAVPQYEDLHWNPDVPGWTQDWYPAYGIYGTFDGSGDASNIEGLNYFEFSHPLDSTDDPHDFSLFEGDTVGFALGYYDDGLSVGWFPGVSGSPGDYGDIAIASKPLPKTWSVDDDGPADFHTIQEAIDAANPEDTIYVYNGTYHEHVIVNKRVSLTGENKDTTIIDGSGTGTVIHVKYANNVEVSGFTIRNGGSGWYDPWNSGISVESSTGCTIVDNRIADNNLLGVHLSWSSYSTLKDNDMTNNRYSFLVSAYFLSDFMHDIGTSNTVNGKPVHYLINQNGLTIDSSSFPDIGYLGVINSTNIVVRDIDLTQNGQGVLFAYTNNSRIENVNASLNTYGIEQIYSNGNTLVGNEITQNGYYGIFSLGSQNTFSRNIIEGNPSGIHIYSGSSENVLEGNVLKDNSIGAILYSDNNLLYHNNFVNNWYMQVYVPGYANAWDDGYPSGGNYWSDYTGDDLSSGPNQDETGNDGIWDHSYVIDSNNEDRYPLVNPWVPRTVGVQVGDWVKYVPLEITGYRPGFPVDRNVVEWGKTTVQAVSGTTMEVELLFHLKNGTDLTVTGPVDVVTSGYPGPTFMSGLFISKGLPAGAPLYATYPFGATPTSLKINETIFKEYLGVSRETNHVNATKWGIHIDAYWDRATGVLCEYKEDFPTRWSWRFRIVDTNLWRAPVATSSIDIAPDTLNLRNKGRWITAYIELPEDYSVSDIDVSSIKMNNTVLVDSSAPTEIGDHDDDGVSDLMVKFNRAELTRYIYDVQKIKYGNVTLTLTGELTDGTLLEGGDVVTVMLRGDVNSDRVIDILDLALIARAFGTNPSYPQGTGWDQWNPNADLNQDNKVDITDLFITGGSYGATIP